MDKIAMFCQVEPEDVVEVLDVKLTYSVPLLLEQQKLTSLLSSVLQLDTMTIPKELVMRGQSTWLAWKNLVNASTQLHDVVKVTLVGKYTALHDSYMSTIKSLEHAAMHCGRKLNLEWVDSTDLEVDMLKISPANYHRAWHMVCTAKYALTRENARKCAKRV